jgi:hypothetical protein
MFKKEHYLPLIWRPAKPTVCFAHRLSPVALGVNQQDWSSHYICFSAYFFSRLPVNNRFRPSSKVCPISRVDFGRLLVATSYVGRMGHTVWRL